MAQRTHTTNESNSSKKRTKKSFLINVQRTNVRIYISANVATPCIHNTVHSPKLQYTYTRPKEKENEKKKFYANQTDIFHNFIIYLFGVSVTLSDVRTFRGLIQILFPTNFLLFVRVPFAEFELILLLAFTR